MEALHITYEILGRPGRREYVLHYVPGRMSPNDVALALIKHEFSEVDYPFGSSPLQTPEEALKRFCIVNVSYSAVCEPAPTRLNTDLAGSSSQPGRLGSHA